ncbi:MAG TPA: BREX-3 system phosphatase PglZ [Symbiobacteriaceae bacterium]|nr:BREX-3 system phosphatase PglZ [Symbiobacteriaceae bacterium]
MMQSAGSTWQQQLLKWFTPEIATVAPVTVLIDPDGLYQDPALLAAMEGAGFAILRYDDPLRFRLTYEREYRERWDRGAKTRALVIHSHIPGEDLPFDLVEEVALADHIRTVKLSDFFDHLDPNLLLELDRDLLGTLWTSYQHQPPGHGGVNATADYLLAKVFLLNPEPWHTPAALLSSLLAHHYRGRALPAGLVHRLVTRLESRFSDWPLRQLWADRATFYQFLAERWFLFLHHEIPVKPGTLRETPKAFILPGPVDLPFSAREVRVYLDTLFLEGQIPPAKGIDQREVPNDWMRLGVAPLTDEDRAQRFVRQTEQLQVELPSSSASHHQWLSFGRKLGEWLATRWRLTLPAEVETEATSLHQEAEQRFAAWVTARFSSMLSLPPIPGPLVVHQVAPHMARGWDALGRPKRALIVVDGMNWAQWSLLRRGLDLKVDFTMQENNILAFAPSITQVSRQALFAGDLPWNFAASITTTSKEEAHWRSFWERQGAMKIQVGYLLYGEGESLPAFLDRLEALTSKPATRIIGLVLGQVDKLTHGAAGVVSSRELQKHVAAWGESGTLRQVLEHLLTAGYELWLTADHGNVEAVGVGNPGTGAMTEERSERALVFTHANLRDATALKFPGAVPWTGAGLPDDYHALLAKGFEAFTSVDKHTLSHGGISIEEMVVPFVRMERNR